jgi:hypothetical protein
MSFFRRKMPLIILPVLRLPLLFLAPLFDFVSSGGSVVLRKWTNSDVDPGISNGAGGGARLSFPLEVPVSTIRIALLVILELVSVDEVLLKPTGSESISLADCDTPRMVEEMDEEDMIPRLSPDDGDFGSNRTTDCGSRLAECVE